MERALNNKKYKETEKNYQLIKNDGVSVIVPWEGEAGLFKKISAAEREGKVTAALIREAAPITVACYDTAAVEACATQLKLQKGKTEIKTGTYILNSGFEKCYDGAMGLDIGSNVHECYML